jgi:L-ascorbate metabolism protein UlaG (beta-lactamase superfamily)
MSIELTWFGHATWRVRSGGKTIVIDPFIVDNPACAATISQVGPADLILVTHGHADHCADCPAMANQNQATVVAVYEIATWLQTKHKVASAVGMNLGGQKDFGFCQVKMTVAHHSSELPDGTYGGNPAGFVLTIAGKKIYFAGDTALFSDMQLIGKLGIDAAILPIGDLFTMGPIDSVSATLWIQPTWVFPSHYNTWPPIAQDPQTWADMIRQQTKAQPIVLNSGQSHSI